MSDNKTETYANNFERLSKINEALQRGENNPGLIDELAEKIAQATKSYQICSDRLKAAQKVLDEHKASQNIEDNTAGQ